MTTTWANWSGTVRGAPDRLVPVATEEQVRAIVCDDRARACGIGVAGAGHSYSGIVSPTGRTLLDLRGHHGLSTVDRTAMTVTVKAGTTLRELNWLLAEEGLALPNQAAIDAQTVAGAVATATHGSAPRLGSLSSHVVAARLVTADGEVRSVRAGDPEIDGVRVHLGCLGVVTALTVEVVPARTLRRVVARMPLDRAVADLDELRTAAYGGLWWYPDTDEAVVWRAEPGGDLRRDEALVDVVPSSPSQGLEYAVPVAHAAAAVIDLADTVRRNPWQVTGFVDIRFTAADTAWLSPSHARDTCHIGVTCRPESWTEPFTALDTLLSAYEGRPHWGKTHFRTGAQLAASYPRWRDFQDLRRTWDPDDVFLGDHLRALFTGVLA